MSLTHKLFLLIIAISSLSLFISPSFSATNTNYSTLSKSTKSNYTSFVKTLCNTTTYPSLCRKTCLPKASKIAGNNQRLATTALSATLISAKSAASTVSKLSRRKDLSKYDASVIRDCIENMGDSIDELKQSIGEMNGLGTAKDDHEMKFKVSNIRTWMSACITNENTCMEGIEEGVVSPRVKIQLRKTILDVAKLTSNALSLCNHIQF